MLGLVMLSRDSSKAFTLELGSMRNSEIFELVSSSNNDVV